MEPVEVAAMREVCRVGGWETPPEFSLNSPNSPAVLMHWRALMELLGLMPAASVTHCAAAGSRWLLVRESRGLSGCKVHG